jgi:hypothetical protein
MAKDFFRQFDGIYSRVVPVYERPETPGDYAAKYIVSRPKTRQEKELKEKLLVNFYPEGGHLIAGQPCTVAFEATDEDGEVQNVQGWVRIPDSTDSLRIETTHQGRGLFTVNVPADGRLRAGFMWHGKRYTFNLPKTEDAGCALHLDAVGDQLKADIRLSGLPDGRQYGVAVLCRGVLKYFETITGSTVLTIDKSQLTTGVCNLIVIDEEGKPLDPIDHDRVYGWINDGKDLVLVQYYVFDKVLKPAEYYEAGHPIYSDGPLFYEVKE